MFMLKQIAKSKNIYEENLIAFRIMFQDDINLMDDEHMERRLGHRQPPFEVKLWSVDWFGQQTPSG